jgi:hypothetical protein
MTEGITASALNFSLGFCARKSQTPKGREACIAAERLEYGAPQTNNTNASSVDLACEKKTKDQEVFRKHDRKCRWSAMK